MLAWTLTIGGAFLTLARTGAGLRSLSLDLGDAELEAAFYNLLLLLEQAGPYAMLAAWIVGTAVILLVAAILLKLAGLFQGGRAAANGPASRPPASPAERPARAPMRLPSLPGPWNRPAQPAPPPPQSAPAPDRPASRPPAAQAPAARPPIVTRPIVERGGRPDASSGGNGTVVVQRPRGHMDRS